MKSLGCKHTIPTRFWHGSMQLATSRKSCVCRGMNMCKLAQLAWMQVLEKGDTALDATCGNGVDTLFLSQAVGKAGTVIACDIQQRAVDVTQALLQETLVEDCRPALHLERVCHSKLLEVLDRYTGSSRPKVITLNLGYLPNADKSLTTETHTTRAALEQALQAVSIGGVVSCMCYRHNEEEFQMVSELFSSLPGSKWAATETKLTNKKAAPVLCLAWRHTV